MVTPQQRATIADEIKVWMDEERMFTAYEISRALKAKGIGLRHGEMKSHIHSAISATRSRRYTRTLMDVGAPVQAWVYHPMTKNPYQFKPLPRQAGSGTDQQAGTTGSNKFKPRNQVPIAQASDELASARDGAYGCDHEGHLKIPAAELIKIGVGSTTNVHVFGDVAKQKVIIGLPSDVDQDGVESAVTDASGDLTIDHEILEFCDIDWLPSYRVSVEQNVLEISESK